MLEDLSGSDFVVGMKQTIKAIEEKDAKKVFLAKDANLDIKLKIIGVCKAHEIALVETDSMEELGKVCGISRKAATAAILK